MRYIENSTQRMCHAMNNAQTYIRESHTCNILCYRHTITRFCICRLKHSRFQITGNHFDSFNFKHIAHLPSSLSNQTFNSMCQCIQSRRSSQPFRQSVHQFGIYNGDGRNIIRIYTYHLLFIHFVGNHVVDSHFSSRSRCSRQSNDRHGFLLSRRHSFQRNHITEFRVISDNADSF